MKRALLLWVLGAMAVTGAAGDDPEVERFRYARRPDALFPYDNVAIYKDMYDSAPPHLGAGRDLEASEVSSVKLGFIGPLLEEDGPIVPPGFRPGVSSGPLVVFGRNMLHGALLAVEEANAAGGYRGLPYELVRRTDLVQWGQTSNELMHFAYDDKVWAILSSVASNNNHVLARAALKPGVPVVNAGSTDPTLTEHTIPWLVRCINDDRQSTYELLAEMVRVRDHRRIALLRVNDRDGRVGIMEVVKGARRLDRPIVIELRFSNGDTDFADQLRRIAATGADALLLWANPPEGAAIVRQAREMGLEVPIYGFDRLAHPLFLEAAGDAAEGVVVAATLNPDRDDPRWQAFVAAYRERWQAEPDAFAAHAYDGTRLMIAAIERAGLNRVRIRDALYATERFPGVTGEILFDRTLNDVSRPWLARVENGRFHYFRPPDWERTATLQAVLRSAPPTSP